VMAFTCPRCGRTSHNPNDEREGYCGACHDWTGGQQLHNPWDENCSRRLQGEPTNPDVRCPICSPQAKDGQR